MHPHGFVGVPFTGGTIVNEFWERGDGQQVNASDKRGVINLRWRKGKTDFKRLHPLLVWIPSSDLDKSKVLVSHEL